MQLYCPFQTISQGRDATPYLERNRVGRDAIDSAAALTDMGKYLFRERRLPVYDIAVAITKYVYIVSYGTRQPHVWLLRILYLFENVICWLIVKKYPMFSVL